MSEHVVVPPSRQVVWQQKQIAEGRCPLCANPRREGYIHCTNHVIKRNFRVSVKRPFLRNLIDQTVATAVKELTAPGSHHYIEHKLMHPSMTTLRKYLAQSNIKVRVHKTNLGYWLFRVQ